MKSPHFPTRFRTQLSYVVDRVFGKYYEGFLGVGREYPRTNALWIACYDILVRELGVPTLSSSAPASDKKGQVLAFITECPDSQFESFLSFLIEYMYSRALPFQRHFYPNVEEGALQPVDEAIADINRYLGSNGLKYKIAEGRLVALDRVLTFEQIENPALQMLDGDERFKAAAEELHEAVSSRRSGSPDDAIRNASHALESTIDIIGRSLGWTMPSGRQLSALLSVVRQNRLIGNRELDALDRHFVKFVEVVVGGARDVEPGAGHGAGSGGDVDPIKAEFVVDVACAAIKALYSTFRARERSKS